MTPQEYKKRLRKATIEIVNTSLLFLQSDGAVNYKQILEATGKSDKDEDIGRTIGGILSTLSRTILDGEPFIISLGPDPSDKENKRRLLWKLNPQAVDEKNRPEFEQAAKEVLEERK